ncbi:hypothetical protein V6N13_033418 [Hibiscus sabdariffa]
MRCVNTYNSYPDWRVIDVAGNGNQASLIIINVVASVVGILVLLVTSICIFQRTRNTRQHLLATDDDEVIRNNSLQLDFATVEAATNNFSDANKLGQGGFGAVYKDFGMARLFVRDETHGDTSRVVGTYGYMAPEYVMHGRFSVKSDVFSFGVIVLEIVSGQKNNNFQDGETVEDLISSVSMII